MIAPYRWAGSKRQLLPELEKRLPSAWGTYRECFAGGASLFFHLFDPELPFLQRGNGSAVLSDTNARVIRTMRAIRNAPEDVIYAANRRPRDQETFLDMRAQNPDGWSDVGVAVWFLYLVNSSFNGLYRVSKAGLFNAPRDAGRKGHIVDHERIRACSRALQRADLRVCDFGETLREAEPGDFVFCDSPYVPLSDTSSFVSYTAHGFTMADQIRLRDAAASARQRGVHVLLSNSSAPAVFELYSGWQIDRVSARRSINCKGGGRGPVDEVLIY